MNTFRAMSRVLVVAAVVFVGNVYSDFAGLCKDNKFTIITTVVAKKTESDPLKKAVVIGVAGGLDVAHMGVSGMAQCAAFRGGTSYVTDKASSYLGVNRKLVKRYLPEGGYVEYFVDVVADDGLVEAGIVVGAVPVAVAAFNFAVGLFGSSKS